MLGRVWVTNVYTGVYFNDFIKPGIAQDINKIIISNGMTGNTGGWNALNVYVLMLTTIWSKKLAISKYFGRVLLFKMGFIQQLAEVDDDDSMADNDQEEKHEVRHQINLMTILLMILIIFRIKTQKPIELQISQQLDLCSDPENYMSDCFDEFDYNFGDFKGFKKRIKKVCWWVEN